MANALDYVEKFGHLKFEQKGFTDVDNLVFSLLSYLDFSNTRINENTLTLEEVGREFLMHNTFKEVSKKGVAQAGAYQMLEKVIDAERYRKIRVSDYIYDTNSHMMFSAMIFHLTKNLDYIAFEGTDEMISGWREDFELAHSFPVPSHIEAVKYLNEHIHLFGPRVIVGGHSKGGNLALVGCMMMKRLKWMKVTKVYNNDGPGLRKAEFESPEYARVKEVYVKTAGWATLVMIVGFIIAEVFPRPAVSLFTPDPVLEGLAAKGFRITALVFPIIGFHKRIVYYGPVNQV